MLYPFEALVEISDFATGLVQRVPKKELREADLQNSTASQGDHVQEQTRTSSTNQLTLSVQSLSAWKQVASATKTDAKTYNQFITNIIKGNNHR